ncbi:MAG: adenylate cyclase [Thermoleophilaceae bacterium]|nr:adenylate cyclase [Thermoleophilaceae bacterium]
MLGTHEKYTAKELAEKTGVPLDVLERQWQALGLPVAGRDEKVYGDEDLRGAELLKQFIDAGLPQDGITQVARVLGEGMRRIADASMQLVGQALARPDDNERDAGLRYAAVAEQLIPVIGPELEYVYRVQLRELVRNDVVSRVELETGKIEGTQEVTVCFADLVGFTKLGEEIPPEDLSVVAGRLAELASDVAVNPVRLVKTIGDAAMLVGTEAGAVVDTALELVRRSDEAGKDFPPLRSGIAHGLALQRAGDWYGSPVNTASRVTGVARPSSVLCTEEARAQAGDRFRWSPAGRRRLKGVTEPVRLFRARPPQD